MWDIGKGILWLLDGFFNIIDKIWRYDFFNNDYVNKIFNGALIVAGTWLILKVVIELIMNFIVKNDGKGNPLTVYRGIILAIVMMFLVTPLFDFGHKVSTSLTDSIINVSGLESGTSAESNISNAIVRSMVYEDKTEPTDIEVLVNNWKNIDINETVGGVLGIGDCYKYSLNFFMLIVLSIVTIFLLFFVAIQMAKRVMEIALFKIIAPFCCTSLTNGGKAFETWCKSTMGLFLTTAVQFISIGLLLTIFNSAFEDNGFLTGIFLVIGALLFIIGTPTIINSLLGHQTGMMSAFGDMQSLMAIGQASAHGMAGAMGALSFGTKVLGKGGNVISNGIGKASSMMNHSGSLKPEQKEIVQDFINDHNGYMAFQKNNNFVNENSGRKYNNSVSNVPLSRFGNMSRTQYSPIRNNYIHNNTSKDNNQMKGNV